MGSSIALAAAASAALAFQVAIPAAAPAPLKPSGPWNVEYADDMCILQRAFGNPGERVILGFKPGILSDQMRLIVIRNSDEKSTIRGDAKISFDAGAPVTARFAEGYIQSKGVRAVQIDLEKSNLARLPNAKHLRIQAGKLDLVIAPTAVALAMKALEACEKDLLVSWGMKPEDVAALGSAANHPKSLVSIFSFNDYPAAAIRNNEQGTAGVRFWIGTDGKAIDCQVVESSGSKILDDETCRIIEKRARYAPARNNSGEAMRSIGFQRIRWEMPGY